MSRPESRFFEKRVEAAVLTVLRRIIPGDYRDVAGARHPVLEVLGIDTYTAGFWSPTAVVGMLLSETLSVRDKLAKAMVDSPGSWFWTLHPGGSSKEALWAVSAHENPLRVTSAAYDLASKSGTTGGGIMVRPFRGLGLVAVQGTLLHNAVKNYRFHA